MHHFETTQYGWETMAFTAEKPNLRSTKPAIENLVDGCEMLNNKVFVWPAS